MTSRHDQPLSNLGVVDMVLIPRSRLDAAIYEKVGRRASSRPLGAFKIGWASKASVDKIHIDIDYNFDRRRLPALSTSDSLCRHVIQRILRNVVHSNRLQALKLEIDVNVHIHSDIDLHVDFDHVGERHLNRFFYVLCRHCIYDIPEILYMWQWRWRCHWP